MPATRAIAVLTAVAIVFVTAGWAVGQTVYEPELEPIAASDTVATTTPPPSEAPASTEPATTAPPATDSPHPSADDPLRVVLAGDSVMAGLVPALTAALDGGGETDVRFVLTPSILREPTVRFAWKKELERFDPELIVLFVGFWELGQIQTGAGQSVGPSEEGWREAYDQEVLDPWLDFVTQAGARVLWIGTPAIDDVVDNAAFIVLNDAWRDAAGRWSGVSFVDAGVTLGRPQDGFSAFVDDEDGDRVRVRQLDGLHLCPEGAELVAADVLTVVQTLWDVDVSDDWRTDDWRSDPDAYPTANCP